MKNSTIANWIVGSLIAEGICIFGGADSTAIGLWAFIVFGWAIVAAVRLNKLQTNK